MPVIIGGTLLNDKYVRWKKYIRSFLSRLPNVVTSISFFSFIFCSHRSSRTFDDRADYNVYPRVLSIVFAQILCRSGIILLLIKTLRGALKNRVPVVSKYWDWIVIWCGDFLFLSIARASCITQRSNLDVFYFRRIDRSNDAMRISKTVPNSSWSLIRTIFPLFQMHELSLSGTLRDKFENVVKYIYWVDFTMNSDQFFIFFILNFNNRNIQFVPYDTIRINTKRKKKNMI